MSLNLPCWRFWPGHVWWAAASIGIINNRPPRLRLRRRLAMKSWLIGHPPCRWWKQWTSPQGRVLSGFPAPGFGAHNGSGIVAIGPIRRNRVPSGSPPAMKIAGPPRSSSRAVGNPEILKPARPGSSPKPGSFCAGCSSSLDGHAPKTKAGVFVCHGSSWKICCGRDPQTFIDPAGCRAL